MEFDLPKDQSSIIKVIGVGGGGSNAVNHMYNQGIKGVDFLICNTDAQALEMSPVPNKIQLGTALTEGRGAGSIAEVGKNAALENIEEITEILSKNTKMVFITAGMGGGTGTGAAPIIAKTAKEMGILTVGIVTFPFTFEGKKRRIQAEEGLAELRANVDTLLVISNDKLREIYGNLSLANAFCKADDILTTAAKGIAEIITVTGYINVDFEDVKTVMTNSGAAIMGSAVAQGENRALAAVEEALASPLLNDNNIQGADYILLYITSGSDEVLMDEISEITDYIQDEAGATADIIWGTGQDEALGENISVTIVATGFDSKKNVEQDTLGKREERKVVHQLDDSIPTKVETPSVPVTPVNEVKDEVVENHGFELRVEETPVEDKIDVTPVVDEITPVVDHTPVTPINDVTSEDTSSKVTYDLNEDVLPSKTVDNTFGRQNISHTVNPSESFNSAFANQEPVIKHSLYDNEAKEERVEDVTSDITPSINADVEEKHMDAEEQLRKSQERIARLKNLSMKLKTPSGINELENVPAYQRKNIQLDDVPHSSDRTESRYTLGDGEDNSAEIRPNNSFLHDNVD